MQTKWMSAIMSLIQRITMKSLMYEWLAKWTKYISKRYPYIRFKLWVLGDWKFLHYRRAGISEALTQSLIILMIQKEVFLLKFCGPWRHSGARWCQMVQDEYNNDRGQCFNLRLSFIEVQKMDTITIWYHSSVWWLWN